MQFITIITLILNIKPLHGISYTSQYSGWIPTQITLPRAGKAMAVGYNNNTKTIWLLGGVENDQQLISFTNNTFKDHGEFNLSQPTMGQSQYYTQIDNIIYILRIATIHTFDVDLIEFYTNPLLATAPISPHNRACVTSFIDMNNNQYLILLGGNGDPTYVTDASINNTQIFNITSNLWLNNIPSMNTKRQKFTCQVYNNQILYAIGGKNLATRLNTIEIYNLTDINQVTQQWRYIQNLSMSLSYMQSVVYHTDILVIGGEGDANVPQNFVHIINTLNNEVSVGADLDVSLFQQATIIADDILYLFGGLWNSPYGDTNTYRYNELLPTNNPTIIPSVSPTTDMPTLIPTHNPTIMPSRVCCDCTVATLEIGCGPTQCENLICVAELLSCCDYSWDETCAKLASDICNNITSYSTNIPITTLTSSVMSTDYHTSYTTNPSIITTMKTSNNYITTHPDSIFSTLISIIDTSNTLNTSSSINNSNDSNKSDNITIIIISLCVVIIICCAFGIILYMIYKQKMKQNNPVKTLNGDDDIIGMVDLQQNSNVMQHQNDMTILDDDNRHGNDQNKVFLNNEKLTKGDRILNKNDVNQTVLKERCIDMSEAEKVKSWLTNNCGLPQYYNIFIDNAFNSMDIVETIDEKSILNDIGIKLLGHRSKIWEEIQKLQPFTKGKQHKTRSGTNDVKGHIIDTSGDLQDAYI